jgi:hypothetical protein
MASAGFSSDIKPLFAPFVDEMRWRLDLTRYEDVRENALLIYTFIRSSDPDGRMPPAPFAAFTIEQISRFKQWIDDGFPP